ncbi:MAG: hypothetical protein MK193_03615 [Lentisphaeria bacterium]|nr:hypothetical protein [Lentisphaeria bacterium]
MMFIELDNVKLKHLEDYMNPLFLGEYNLALSGLFYYYHAYTPSGLLPHDYNRILLKQTSVKGTTSVEVLGVLANYSSAIQRMAEKDQFVPDFGQLLLTDEQWKQLLITFNQGILYAIEHVHKDEAKPDIKNDLARLCSFLIKRGNGEDIPQPHFDHLICLLEDPIQYDKPYQAFMYLQLALKQLKEFNEELLQEEPYHYLDENEIDKDIIPNRQGLETFLANCNNPILNKYGYSAFKGMLIVEQTGLSGPTEALLMEVVTNYARKDKNIIHEFRKWLHAERSILQQQLEQCTFDIGWHFYQQQPNPSIKSENRYLKGICKGIVFILAEIEMHIRDLQSYFLLTTVCGSIVIYPETIPNSDRITELLDKKSPLDQVGTKLKTGALKPMIEALTESINWAYDEQNRDIDLNFSQELYTGEVSQRNFVIPCKCPPSEQHDDCCDK